MASGQEDGRVGRASNGEEDATGNKTANEDVQIAIAGVNYPIAGAPHPINELGRLRKCELIPPPHGATPPLGGQRTVNWKSVPQPPPHGATPPLGGSTKSDQFPTCESILPPHGAIPPLSGPLTANQKSLSQPPRCTSSNNIIRGTPAPNPLSNRRTCYGGGNGQTEAAK